jgi:hypothetical protein
MFFMVRLLFSWLKYQRFGFRRVGYWFEISTTSTSPLLAGWHLLLVYCHVRIAPVLNQPNFYQSHPDLINQLNINYRYTSIADYDR